MRTAAIFLLLSSAAAAQVTVTGQFRYEDRTYDGTGFTGTAFRPVRQAEIELLSSGSTLVISTTDETGSFSFANIPSGLSLQVRVYARRVGGRINATVRNNAGANAIYAAISGTIDSSTTSSFGTLDLLRGGAGPAFNIFDCAVKSFQHLAALEPGLSLTPPPMNIFWELNSPNGTYFDGSVNGIFLLGLTSDPDQYDDDIILHEMGHWVAATFSKDDTLGGAHSVVDQLDPRTSWSEGWAHYWSATVRRFFSSEYSNPELQVDNFGSGRSVFDIELPSFPTLAIMATNELAVVAVLWDISDGGALEPFDTVSGFEAEIWRTLSVRIPARSNITLEDFHAGLSLEAPAIMPAVTGSETTAGIFKDRLIRYYVDGSEPNNTPGAPAPLPLGPVGLLQRTFYDSTDDDWFTLSATPGTLVVETLNLGDGADTGLQLYDATGTTLLASNDNRAAGDRTSRITLSLLVNTTFLVHVVRVGSVVEYGYYDLRAQILLNGPPAILSVSASALSGIAPLRVTFSASVSDPDGGSLEYLWDFDGDSLVDWSSLQGPDVTMTYDEAGTYAATLKVVDSGESTVGSAPLTITVWAADSPSIIPTVSVGSGAAPLTVTFDATLSGLVSTSYLWDFDGDGIADSASVTGPGATFTFRRPGTYSPRLIVRDRFGRAYRVPAPPVTVTATSPPSVSSFAVSGGYLPYAATFSMTHSSLGGSGSIAIDLDGDGRFDFVRAPTSTGSSSFLRELQRAGTFGARVRVIDSAGVAAETTATYTARSLGAAGWMVDPRDTDRLAGSQVTLTAEAVPFGVLKTVQFQVRDSLGGPWIDIGAPIPGSGTLFATTWDVSALPDLASFNLRILIDGAVSSGDTANTVVIDSVAPTISETSTRRTKLVRLDRTTISRNRAGAWAIVPLGATSDALPLSLESASAAGPNGSALSMVPVGQAWKVDFAGTFGNSFRLRLPFSGNGQSLEIHRYDDTAGLWRRFGFPRVSHADGWVEADVDAPGVYSLFAAPPAPSRRRNSLCGALGMEGLLILGLLRLLRRRC